MRAILITLLALPLAAMAQTTPGSTDAQAVSLRARAAMDGGDYTEAQKLYERALDLRRETFGESSAPYAAALVDLARAYQATEKRSADAVKLYRQALPIQEATLGPNHPDVATTLYYLALDAHGHKQREAALAMYQRALDIRTKAFGASDPRLAEVLTSMASLNEDEMLYQRALAILDTGGKPTSQTATTLELYARYLTAHDRTRQAEPLRLRATDIRVENVARIGARRPHAEGPKPFRVNAAEGVKAPTLLKKVEPEYTDAARLDKLQGPVVLSIVVGADGLAHDIQLKQGVGLGLDEKAAEAIARWMFNPGIKDGRPVPVAATVEVNFRLL
jgi:TonB family protein